VILIYLRLITPHLFESRRHFGDVHKVGGLRLSRSFALAANRGIFRHECVLRIDDRCLMPRALEQSRTSCIELSMSQVCRVW